MNDATFLHRIIKSGWWLQGEAISSQAFRPGQGESGQVSVYDGDQISAEAAWRHYIKDPHKPIPSGVLAVTVAECHQQALVVRSDPDSFPEHVLIDFGTQSKNQKRKRSVSLRDAAFERGWQYGPIPADETP